MPNQPSQRRVKTKPYKSFRLHKRVGAARPAKLTGAFKLFRASTDHLLKHRWLFLGIVAIYMVLTIVMVKGLGVSVGTAELKTNLEEIFVGSSGALLTGVTIFGVLLSSSSSASSDVASLYQTILVVLTSLAIIWALRQSFADTKTTVKESFYKGMYPLIPFVLVLLMIGLQMLPLLVGSWLYSVVIVGGIAVTGLEQTIWVILIILLSLLSLYMITSSIFGLYIATLPDMTPLKALRSARELVRNRRFMVMRKVLFLPFILLLVGAVIMVPLIILATPLAEWVFFILSMMVLVMIHAYMYNLYRELL